MENHVTAWCDVESSLKMSRILASFAYIEDKIKAFIEVFGMQYDTIISQHTM